MVIVTYCPYSYNCSKMRQRSTTHPCPFPISTPTSTDLKIDELVQDLVWERCCQGNIPKVLRTFWSPTHNTCDKPLAGKYRKNIGNSGKVHHPRQETVM